ncbi:MAG: hypothetical protein M5U34_06885 [Chloroflexi bacterium]|nr:hypothetical protein [Chloroflexota bacterium]
MVLAVSGVVLANSAIGILIFQQPDTPGSSLFPLPFLALVNWATLSVVGAIYIILTELKKDAHQLQGAWGVLGAYIPLILVSVFSFGSFALVSALLLLIPTILLSIRYKNSLSPRLWLMVLIGVGINWIVLFSLIVLDRFIF